MGLYDREWQQANPEAFKALLNKPNPIGSVNQLADPAYAQKQQALYQRLQTTTNPAEKNYLLTTIHPGMLNEQQNIEKFKLANPTLAGPVIGKIDETARWQGPAGGGPSGGTTSYQRLQLGERKYIPGLGIVQANYMGPTFGKEEGGHQSGGLMGMLRRNDEELRRAGGTIMGGALGLMTGNPVLAALMAARGGYTGQAPTGYEVLATALTMGMNRYLPKAPAPTQGAQNIVSTGSNLLKNQATNYLRQQISKLPQYMAQQDAKKKQEKIRAQIAMLQQRRQAQGV